MKQKYPRTLHLPWSPGATSDDKILPNTDCFKGKRVIITEKMDGENSTLAQDYYHARSLDSRDHPSRSWIKAFHASIAHEIPEGWRICGENLFAQHSIKYDNLRSYFYCFSIWDNDRCLSWEDTVDYCELLGVEMVPVLHKPFIWDNIGSPYWLSDPDVLNLDTVKQEGYVVRNADSFYLDDFSKNVAKWVRGGHVQTDEHWMHQAIIPNNLLSNLGFGIKNPDSFKFDPPPDIESELLKDMTVESVAQSAADARAARIKRYRELHKKFI